MKLLKSYLISFFVIFPASFVAVTLHSVGGNLFLVTAEILQHSLRFSSMLAVMIAACLILICWPFRGGSDRYIHIAGPQKFSGHRAFNHAKRVLNVCKRSASILVHPKILLSWAFEIGNFLIFGMQGSGKSTIIKFWLRQVMMRNVVALIYDEKGEYTELFFDAKVLLLSPGDTRSVSWDLSADIIDISSARTLADALIQQTSDEPFWSDSARLIVTGALVCLVKSGNRWGWIDLHSMLFRNMVHLQRQLQLHFPEAAIFADPKDRTSASVLGVISSQMGWLQYVASADSACTTPFSIREWLAAEHPKKLIIQTDPLYRNMSQAIFGAVFSMLTSHVLSLPDSSTRQIWLVLDELAAIPKNNTLEQWLSRGRSKGVRTIAGVQSLSQLQSIYGEKNAETLLGLFATMVVLRIGAPGSAASVASAALGERRVMTTSISTDVNGGNSSTQSEQNLPVVTPEEITHLEAPDATGAHGFLSIAGTNAVYKLQWPYPKLPKIASARISRKSVPATDKSEKPSTNPFLQQE